MPPQSEKFPDEIPRAYQLMRLYILQKIILKLFISNESVAELFKAYLRL